MVLLGLIGCSPLAADHVMAWVRDDDGGYHVGVRALPELYDPVHMAGDLGTIRHGGRILTGKDGSGRYTGGMGMIVHATTDRIDGVDVAVPLDEDGLLLYSFYANLAAVRAAVEAQGVDVEPVFPMAGAWNPAVSPLFELAPADNAAYATGANVFMLLPDGGDRDVPLLANEGVIFHEFGHAVFHLLTSGSPESPPLVHDAASEAFYWQSSLHEGFADTLATLLLDDPAFIDVSIPLPERHVDDDHAVADSDMLPATRADSGALLDDPYPLGTVYASFAWDLRVASDADTALGVVIDAVRDWSPAEAKDVDGAAYLAALLQSADAAGLGDAACASNTARFAVLAVPCP